MLLLAPYGRSAATTHCLRLVVGIFCSFGRMHKARHTWNFQLSSVNSCYINIIKNKTVSYIVLNYDYFRFHPKA